MNKEQLIGLGLTEEQATQVVEGFKDFVPRSRLNEVSEAKKNAEALVAERDKQLNELKKSAGDNEALKAQIEQLQAENKEAKTKYEADLKAVQMNNAIDIALKESGAKNLKAVKALIELGKVTFDGENLNGLADQIEALQKDEGSSFMFESKTFTPTGMKRDTGESVSKPKPYSQMNYAERVAFLNAGGQPD